jgi:hypothetical protein
MNKNAYEIRLDVLIDAHRYCNDIFQHKVSALLTAADKQGKSVSPEDIEKLYPSKKEIISTAELFYEFVSNNHK